MVINSSQYSLICSQLVAPWVSREFCRGYVVIFQNRHINKKMGTAAKAIPIS